MRKKRGMGLSKKSAKTSRTRELGRIHKHKAVRCKNGKTIHRNIRNRANLSQNTRKVVAPAKIMWLRRLFADELLRLAKSDENAPIVVNRALINAKLIGYTSSGVCDQHTSVLMSAVITMKEKERRMKRTLHGAEMKVKDVISIFDIDSSPTNSFFERED